MNDYIEFEKNCQEDVDGEPIDELQEIDESRKRIGN